MFWVVLHHAERNVALVAEETANLTGLVIVVNVILALAHRRAITHSTPAALGQ